MEAPNPLVKQKISASRCELKTPIVVIACASPTSANATQATQAKSRAKGGQSVAFTRQETTRENGTNQLYCKRTKGRIEGVVGGSSFMRQGEEEREREEEG